MISRTGQKRVVIRDLVIFQVKLGIDWVKDTVLLPASILAALIDLVVPGREPGRCFYALLRAGESFDRWLSLYVPAKQARSSEGGLFAASLAGSNTLLGEIEAMVLGHDEPGGRTGREARGGRGG